jgi:hypothetical protein
MFSVSFLETSLTILISIFFIYGCQEIWNYLKDSFTIKKKKNLVDSQIQKYKKIIDEIQQNNSEQGSHNTEFLSKEEKQTMSDELTKLILQERHSSM